MQREELVKMVRYVLLLFLMIMEQKKQGMRGPIPCKLFYNEQGNDEVYQKSRPQSQSRSCSHMATLPYNFEPTKQFLIEIIESTTSELEDIL